MMRANYKFFLILSLSLFAVQLLAERSAAQNIVNCSRIVSLAPSVTEVLFRLGLGQQVVGVTKFCRYPVEAQTKTVIGGFLDPSLETIVSLRPTVVVGLGEQAELLGKIKKLEISTQTLEHRNIAGILQSLRVISQLCELSQQQKQLADALMDELDQLSSLVRGRKKIRVLLAVGGDSEQGLLKNVFVSGSDGFYDELIERAGGTNVVTSATVGFPGVSAEGISALNPEVIFQVMAPAQDAGTRDVNADVIVKAWQQNSVIDAVKHRRVYALSADYASIPGPRVVLLLKDIIRLLHPDLKDSLNVSPIN